MKNIKTLAGFTLKDAEARADIEVLKNKTVSLEETIADLPSGGDAIIDVSVLPTENINENAIYRVNDIEAHLTFNGQIDIINGLSAYINVVDTLPETGEPAIDNPDSPTKCVGYYQIGDNECYCWVPSGLGVEPNRWVPLSDFFSLMDTPYGGIVISTENVQENTAYVLLEYKPNLYHYKDGWHKIGGAVQVVTTNSIVEAGALVGEKAIYGTLYLDGTISYECYDDDGVKNTSTLAFNQPIPVGISKSKTPGVMMLQGSYIHAMGLSRMIILTIAAVIPISSKLFWMVVQPTAINTNTGKWCVTNTDNVQLDLTNFSLKVINEA